MVLDGDEEGWALLDRDVAASGDVVPKVMDAYQLIAMRSTKRAGRRVKSDGPSLSEKQSPSAVGWAQRHHVYHLQQRIKHTQHGTGRTESSPHLH